MTFLKENKINVTIALIAIFTFSTQAKDINETFDIKAGGNLVLDTDVGSIHIDTHNKDNVVLDVEVEGKYEDEFEVIYELTGNTLNVTGKKERSNWSKTRVKFELTVPKNFNLELDTSGGQISIMDLTGEIDARTSGGSVKASNIEGNVKLKTSGGSIKTSDIYGKVNAHTSGGSIRIKQSSQFKDDAEYTTSGGSITALLPDDVKVNLYAATSGGRVSVDYDVNGRFKKRTIKGSINGGGPELRLETSGGSISVEPN